MGRSWIRPGRKNSAIDIRIAWARSKIGEYEMCSQFCATRYGAAKNRAPVVSSGRKHEREEQDLSIELTGVSSGSPSQIVSIRGQMLVPDWLDTPHNVTVPFDYETLC